MSGMKLASMNANDLRKKMENDPDAVVMEPTYDHVFDPWPTDKLKRCIGKIATITQTVETDQVNVEVNKNDELKEFAKLHPKIYEQISKN